MKNGLIIGASQDAIHAIRKAKECGVYVTAIDGNEKAEGLLYADKGIVADITDFETVSTIVEEIKPDFVIPIPIGRYLITTGYVNEKYNLPGIKYNSVLWSTDKYLFHKKLSENGLRDVELHLVNQDSKLEELKIQYPAIMKPRYGSGSRDVFFITNEEELKNAYEKVIILKEDFVLEQAVEGVEYGVDGVVIGGELKITLLRKKRITPFPERQAISYFSEYDEELLKRTSEKLNRTIKILGYNNCLISVDLIINNKDVFVIEIAPRPSGHNLHNVFTPEATGVDIVKEYIKNLMGESFEFAPRFKKHMQIRYFDFNDKLVKKVPELEDLNKRGKCNIIRWNCHIKKGDVLQKVVDGHSIMGRGFFIVEGAGEEDLVKQSEWILEQFEVEDI